MIERQLDDELSKGIYQKRPIMKVIKLKCMDCCGGSYDEVKKCTSDKTCFLHPYRLGKNQFNKRELTEEQKEQARERFAKYREGNKNG